MAVSLSARNVVKRYGAVIALSDANLDIHSGEVVALVGANGSGKSTLTKIINGVVALDGGQLLRDDRPIHLHSPSQARNMGIATVFQELSLVPKMTVAENIWLTREPLLAGSLVDERKIHAETDALLSLFAGTYKTALEPDLPVANLPADEKQIVEILKAICSDPQLIILDEATASLDKRQVERLFQLVTQWKEEGKAVVFVSHRMEEIFQVADRYSVLRNGETVGAGAIKEVTAHDLVEMMVGQATPENAARHGRETDESMPPPPPRSVQLAVEGLTTDVLKGISFELHAGELLGIGGLKGQGQEDLLLSLFGDIPFTGRVTLRGKPVHFKHPRQAIEQGVALVPGERAREGLLIIRSILENIQLPSWRKYGLITRIRQAATDALRVASSLRLVMAGLDQPVSTLSGGNAQKVVIGKWLLRNPSLLLLDDPTKGVDVNTKAEFYHLLVRLSDEGMGVLFYSSDDEELVGLCDRVLVMYEGAIQAELSGEALTEANLIAASLGTTHAPVNALEENPP